MANVDFLKKMSNVNGVSGHEGKVRKILKEEFLKLVSEENITCDGLGSIVAKHVGEENGPKIIIAGHMDEIGMIVTKITDEGYLKFQTIGGWWSQVMLAEQMTVTTSTGKEYLAVVGSKPPHILSPEELKNPANVDEMYLDLGVKDKDEAISLGIKVGDMVTPYIKATQMANPKYLMGKAWDNRIGCVIALDVMKRLKEEGHPNILYSVGTVQEEVGLRGARTAAQMVNPDIVFALDVTIARDVPGTDGTIKMGDGPAVMLYDSSMIGHVGLREYVVKVLEEKKIPYQFDYLKRGGTDAGAMHLVHSGAPAMAVCLPSRYIHSHTSMIHTDDYENCVNLLVEVIKGLDAKKVHEIIYE